MSCSSMVGNPLNACTSNIQYDKIIPACEKQLQFCRWLKCESERLRLGTTEELIIDSILQSRSYTETQREVMNNLRRGYSEEFKIEKNSYVQVDWKTYDNIKIKGKWKI